MFFLAVTKAHRSTTTLPEDNPKWCRMANYLRFTTSFIREIIFTNIIQLIADIRDLREPTSV